MDVLQSLEQTLLRFPNTVLLALAQCLWVDFQDSRPSLVSTLARRLLSPDARWLLSQQEQVYQQFYEATVRADVSSTCPCNAAGGLPITCSRCRGTQHLLCVFRLLAPPRPYLCPKCLLLDLCPMAPVSACLTPCFPLIGSAQWATATPVGFEVDAALMNRIWTAGGTVQVQLRCIQLKKEPASAWPSRGALLVNGKVAAEFTGTAQRPLTLTKLLREGKNSLCVVKLTNEEAYVALLCIVDLQTPGSVVQKILTNTPGTSRSHKEALLAKLKSDGVLIKSVRIPLKCPLSFNQIRIPARGSACQHLECFDLQAFVDLHSSTSKWKCPVCARPCPELLVDKFLLKVLRSASRPFTGVEVSATGVCRRYKETLKADFIVLE